jgi:hypothetical protein
MADFDQFVKDLEAGEYDNQLGAVFDALFARAAETDVSFGWKLKLGDDEWTIESVTLQELAFAEKACSTGTNRVSYLELDPMRSMDHLVALVVAHLHHVNGHSVPDAFAQARKLTVSDLKDIVSAYEVKATPKEDAGATSTIS